MSASPDPSAVSPRGHFLPMVQGSLICGAAPQVSVDAPRTLWAPPQPRIPESPGPGLLGEFDALYHKYERRVYRICLRMLGNEEDAEDLRQEVFLQLFRKANTFRGDAMFSTWLHRLTVNTALMQLRRVNRWRQTVTSLDAPGDDGKDAPLTASALAVPAMGHVDKLSLDLAVAQLSSGYQEVFELHDVQGYRHNEIAKLLGISEGTSKSQLHKARLRLRELIQTAEAGDRRPRHARGVRKLCKKRRRSRHAAEYACA